MSVKSFRIGDEIESTINSSANEIKSNTLDSANAKSGTRFRCVSSIQLKQQVSV